MHASVRSGWNVALIAVLGSAMLGAAAPPKKGAASGPTPMTYLRCDFETFTKFPRGGDPASIPVSVTKAYGFREKPLAVVDVSSPKMALEPLGIADTMIEFQSANRFDVLALYSTGEPYATAGDVASYRATINRVTGWVNVTFYVKYGPDEIAACKKQMNGPWCNHGPVAAVLSGKCQQVRRRF